MSNCHSFVQIVFSFPSFKMMLSRKAFWTYLFWKTALSVRSLTFLTGSFLRLKLLHCLPLFILNLRMSVCQFPVRLMSPILSSFLMVDEGGKPSKHNMNAIKSTLEICLFVVSSAVRQFTEVSRPLPDCKMKGSAVRSNFSSVVLFSGTELKALTGVGKIEISVFPASIKKNSSSPLSW